MLLNLSNLLFLELKIRSRETKIARAFNSRHDSFVTIYTLHLIILLKNKDLLISPIRHPKPVFVNKHGQYQRGSGHGHVTLVLHKPPVAGFKLRGHLNLGNLLLEGPPNHVSTPCIGGGRVVNHSGGPSQPPVRLSFLRSFNVRTVNYLIYFMGPGGAS